MTSRAFASSPPISRLQHAPDAHASTIPSLVVAAIAGCAIAVCVLQQHRAEPSPALVAPQDTSTSIPVQRGVVSHYGYAFAGRKTASGDVFDPELMTMAHRTLPFGTRVRVTNLENRRSVEVVVNDRGPFVAGRVADVSLGAARALAMVRDGVVEGTLEIVAPAR